ncbi:hypothetical protein EON83_05625 [bacterium]|nr:MAG: hypothetical protein EON83_05625 [bacterium]
MRSEDGFMSEEKRTLLWVTNELLNRFTDIFWIAGNDYTFKLLSLPSVENASHAVANYVEKVSGANERCNWQTQITILKHGERELNEALQCWLKAPFWHLDHTFSQVQSNSPLADLVLDCLNRMGVVHCWRVCISKPEGEYLIPHYESSWDDFLIQTPEGFLFLHLGVST